MPSREEIARAADARSDALSLVDSEIILAEIAYRMSDNVSYGTRYGIYNRLSEILAMTPEQRRQFALFPETP